MNDKPVKVGRLQYRALCVTALMHPIAPSAEDIARATAGGRWFSRGLNVWASLIAHGLIEVHGSRPGYGGITFPTYRLTERGWSAVPTKRRRKQPASRA
jgi:hypothetical protein